MEGFAEITTIGNMIGNVYLNCSATNNGGNGFDLVGRRKIVRECNADNNTGIGFNLIPSTVPIAASPNGAVVVANVATITTTVPHGLTAGQKVIVSGVTNVVFNNVAGVPWTVLGVPAPTPFSFSYALVTADITSGSGTVSFGDTQTVVEESKAANNTADGYRNALPGVVFHKNIADRNGLFGFIDSTTGGTLLNNNIYTENRANHNDAGTLLGNFTLPGIPAWGIISTPQSGPAPAGPFYPSANLSVSLTP